MIWCEKFILIYRFYIRNKLLYFPNYKLENFYPYI